MPATEDQREEGGLAPVERSPEEGIQEEGKSSWRFRPSGIELPELNGDAFGIDSGLPLG